MCDRTRSEGLRTVLVGAILAAAAISTAGPLAAQEDTRWLPWVGCWEAVDEAGSGEMLCVRPTAGGVEFVTVAEGEVVSTEVLPSDGRMHAVEAEGCVGSQSASFSDDRNRVFVTSEMTCEGEFRRETTGVMAMTSPSTWVDVQAGSAGGGDLAWVRHFRLAPQARVEEAGLSAITAGRGMAISTARYHAASPVEVDDVLEAADRVHGEAVKAWVAELRDPFELDGETLVALSDAGLDPEVIDVMVAVSYPEHFRLDRDEAEAGRYADDADGRWGRRGYHPSYGYWGGRLFYDPFFYGYGYNSWGYRYGGYWGGYGYRPGVIVVSPSDGVPSSGGRVVKGRGYTRPGSGSSDRPSTRSGGDSRGTTSAGSSGSSGSGRTPTGRTAKPRGGGGGGGGEGAPA